MFANIALVLSVVAIVWLVVLSVLLYLNTVHYKKLIGKTSAGDLKAALDSVLASETKNKKDIQAIQELLGKIQKEEMKHLQKLGLVRYNPFSDTGGDHSFSLSVLDANGSGYLLTGLHTREKTRFYLKSIQKGQATRELSKEEQRAVELALKS